jgi:hypothetical protein
MSDINYDTLAPGNYTITDDGIVKKTDTKEIVFQGVGADFDVPFPHFDGVIILKSGCFGTSILSDDIRLLIDHDEKSVIGKRDTSSIYRIIVLFEEDNQIQVSDEFCFYTARFAAEAAAEE